MKAFLDMLPLRLALASLVFACNCGAPSQQSASAAPSTGPGPVRGAIGANLTRATYYSQAWPFVDLIKHADPWISGRPEHPDVNRRWDDGGTVAMDTNGWVTRLESGQVARKFILASETHFHAGRYTVLHRGRGQLDYRGSVSNLERGRDRDTFDLALGEGLWLELVSTDPADPMREIHIIPPGGRCANDGARYCEADSACAASARCVPFTQTFTTEPFHPEFLADIASASVLRFMDWMETNRPASSEPSERVTPPVRTMADWTTPDDASHYPVPFETIIALSNQQHVDPWITIPHEATDDFVRDVATRFATGLDPSLKLYVEYSNEVWNGMFGQAVYANREGCRRFSRTPSECDGDGDGLLCEPGPWDQAMERCVMYGRRFHAHRTAQVIRIFESVYGAASAQRLVRVVAWQTGSLMDSGLELLREDVGGEPLSRRVDVFAVAPYFGGGIDAMPSPDAFFRRVNRETFGAPAGTFAILAASPDGREQGPHFFISNDARLLRENEDVRHLRLVAYEGGQHLFTFASGQAARLRALNEDPRMRDVYLQYLEIFATHTNGALFVHYASPGAWWAHGAFGSKEWQGQPRTTAPKHDALEIFAARSDTAR